MELRELLILLKKIDFRGTNKAQENIFIKDAKSCKKAIKEFDNQCFTITGQMVKIKIIN